MPPTLTVYVKDSITKMPVAVAEVSISIGDQKVGVGHTDRQEGCFTKSIDPQYVGQPLTCRVSKDGYGLQEVDETFTGADVRKTVELIPDMLMVTVRVVDDTGGYLAGTKVSLKEEGGGALLAGMTDNKGEIKFTIPANLKGQTILYQARLAGFAPASGNILLEQETLSTIVLRMEDEPSKPVPPPVSQKRSRTWLYVGLAITAIVVLSVVIYWKSQDKKPPRITLSHEKMPPLRVTFRANATDKSGIHSIALYINDKKVKTCNSSPCKFTKNFPIYTSGRVQKVKYRVMATDKKGNRRSKSIEVNVR